ncbi:MAG: 3-hydroxyacyl-ACP dehydratase FabZ [Lachnospirales bacterium]
MVADIKGIMEVIPHRPPFLLIDKIVELEEGKKVVAQKNVTMNEPFFVGHFPGEPVMPGVLQIEALAQAGAYALLSMEEFKGKIAYFGAIKNAKFKRKVIPGDVLTLTLEITKIRGGVGVGEGVVTADGEVCASATLTFAIG